MHNRSPEQIAADQAFLAKARSRSPRFPDVNVALRRRQRQRETITARTLLGMCAIFLIAAPFSGEGQFDLIAAALCFTGFAITCLVAGGRAHTEGETL